jgi:hypothetical protein
VLSGGQGVHKIADTSADGTFRFDQLPAGRFFLNAQREGYAGIRQPPSMVDLAGSEKKTGVICKLQPGAVVTGRVLDEAGEPFVGAQVSILRQDVLRGKARFLPMNSAVTDDRGQYRIHSVAPGRYRLAASAGHTGRFGPSTSAVTYGMTYYPNTRDAQSAQSVRLSPGQELDADFRIEPSSSTHIQGRIIGVGEGQHGFHIQAQPLDSSEMHMAGFHSEMNPEGVFTVRGLPPGKYLLAATLMQAERPLVGTQIVDTRGGSVEGIVVELSRGVELSGKVRVDSGEMPPGMRVMIVPSGIGAMTGPPPQPVEVGADGAFKFAEVMPGIWDVQVAPLPPGGYLKSVTFGGVDVFGKELEISGAAPAPLAIVVSPKGAAVEGTISGAEESPHCLVMALPEDGPRFLSGMQMMSGAAAGGKFRLAGLRPGSYRLLAISPQDTQRVHDPDVFKELESLLPLVKVEEGSQVTQDVKVIASADLDKAEQALQ